MVDSTLATPILLRPLELGADLVLHSATKYIGGHSDLMLGALVARDPRLAERLRERRNVDRIRAGDDGSLARPARDADPGAADATRCRDRCAARRPTRLAPLRLGRALPGPGRPTPPTRASRRLFDGPGAVISFEVDGATRADAVCAAVEVITHASSLGGVETLIERQARWHAEPAVAEGLLRLSVGCEDPADLWRDLDGAR